VVFENSAEKNVTGGYKELNDEELIYTLRQTL
jgi:hypothetical protein